MRYTEDTFTLFLKSIDLEAYREKYSVKIVEMDLPKNIQALDTLYDIYWNKEYKNPKFTFPPLFEEFYKEYYKRCKEGIEDFWKKSGFGTQCDCFQRGLEARIYRTWASLITQIHAGYVAESVFGKDSITQNTKIDHDNIDILAKYKSQDIKIQIKKESKRPEIARMRTDTETTDIYNIWYVVPKASDYEKPYYVVKKKAGQLRDSIKDFVKYNENGTLDRLDNGFVIFTKKEFELIKDDVDKKH